MELTREDLESTFRKIEEVLPTSAEELRHYGQELSELSYNPAGPDEPIGKALGEKYPGASFYNWADGAGNSDSLYIFPASEGHGDRAIYVIYDHESALNFYGEKAPTGFRLQHVLYEEVPEDLKAALTGPEGELLLIEDGYGRSLYHGSAMIYLEDGAWHLPESYVKLALKYGEDGGLRYFVDLEELRKEAEKAD